MGSYLLRYAALRRLFSANATAVVPERPLYPPSRCPMISLLASYDSCIEESSSTWSGLAELPKYPGPGLGPPVSYVVQLALLSTGKIWRCQKGVAGMLACPVVSVKKNGLMKQV